MKKHYKCAKCSRTTYSGAKDIKCPRKNPQCNGVMLIQDGKQTIMEDY